MTANMPFERRRPAGAAQLHRWAAQVKEETMKVWLITMALMAVANIVTAKPSFTAQPSFKCSEATSRTERMICSDFELSQLDLALSNDYLDLMRYLSGNGKSELTKEQRLWLGKRDKCAGPSCLKQALRERSTYIHNRLRRETSKVVKDQVLMNRMVDLGLAALREKYGPPYANGRLLTEENFECEESLGEFSCIGLDLGCATCDDGTRNCVHAKITGQIHGGEPKVTDTYFLGASKICR